MIGATMGGLNAAAQALKKAESLKGKVSSCKDLFSDAEAWSCHQQLQSLYKQVLILDLEYALDCKVEQELWNHGFKNQIGTLQQLIKDGKSNKRTDSQTMLSWFLEAASGFYLMLLQEICSVFDLDLPFRRKGSVYGMLSPPKSESLNQPNLSSCYYVCQHCLVHLGDLARYRNQTREAESYYRHAIQVAPNSGQPYNQLAILEAAKGNKLATVFYYVRSVAVKHPFPASATNLAKVLRRMASDPDVVSDSRLKPNEYVSLFLKVHALLYDPDDQDGDADSLVSALNSSLTALAATESIKVSRLVQMAAINLFIVGRPGASLGLDLAAGTLNALLLPVYMLKDGEKLLNYSALPAVKLYLQWIGIEPAVLKSQAFTSRMQIWPSLSKLLTGIRAALGDFDHEPYSSVPLPEDQDLQGFLPLQPVLAKFTSKGPIRDDFPDQDTAAKIRAWRILDLGRALATESPTLMTYKLETQAFEAVGPTLGVPTEVIRELEELNLNKRDGYQPSPAPSQPSPAPSDASQGTRGSSPDTQGRPAQETGWGLTQETPRPLGGILKQSSTEKKSEPDEPPSVPPARKRQNVALAAIMRRADEKQVTFKTPTPTPDEEKSPPETWKPPPHFPPPPSPGGMFGPIGGRGWNHPEARPEQGFPSASPTAWWTQPPPTSNTPSPLIPPPGAAASAASPTVPFDKWGLTFPYLLTPAPRLPERFQVPPPPLPNPAPIGRASPWGDMFLNSGGSMPPDMAAPRANPASQGTYSLFSTPSWGQPMPDRPYFPQTTPSMSPSTAMFPSQPSLHSLWSGPGLSPLERLLEQQKQQRESNPTPTSSPSPVQPHR